MGSCPSVFKVLMGSAPSGHWSWWVMVLMMTGPGG